MSHPKNKRERFQIGKRKGVKRALGMAWPVGQSEEWFLSTSRFLRNTTKTCNCSICINPRRSGWSKAKEKLTLQELKFLESLKNKSYAGGGLSSGS